MSHRVRNWLVAFAVADVICWALTLDAHFSFHHTPGGPTVMPVGQLLGWSFSILFLIAIAVVLFAVHLDAKYRSRPQRHQTKPRLR